VKSLPTVKASRVPSLSISTKLRQSTNCNPCPKVLRVSADQILGLEPLKENGHVEDRRFVRRLEKVDRLPKRDRQTHLGTIDAFLSRPE